MSDPSQPRWCLTYVLLREKKYLQLWSTIPKSQFYNAFMVVLKIKTRPSMASLGNLNINQTLQCWVTNTPDHHRGPRNLSWFSQQESSYEAGYDSICQPPKKVKERHRQLGNYKGFACSITAYWVHTKLGIPIPFKVLLDFHREFAIF